MSRDEKMIYREYSKDRFEVSPYTKTIAIVKRNAGIMPRAFVLFGLPGETEAMIQSTLDLLRDLKLPAAPNLLFPIPGTLIYKQARAEGKLPPIREMAHQFAKEYYSSGRIVPVVNLTNVSDEFLGWAVRQVREMTRKLIK